MWNCFRIVRSTLLVSGVLVCLTWTPAWAQGTGTIRGIVRLTENGDAIAGALVLVIGPGQTVLTNAEGMFVVEDVPIGTYEILAQREHLTASRQAITILAGETTTVEFELALSPVHEEVTVTATVADSATTYEAFNALTTPLNRTSWRPLISPLGNIFPEPSYEFVLPPLMYSTRKKCLFTIHR